MSFIVDESYIPQNRQDLYDAVLNVLFPITFVVLLNVRKEMNMNENNKELKNSKTEIENFETYETLVDGQTKEMNENKEPTFKEIALPLLDDVLYNIVTWMIPLVVSFAYKDILSMKIFSLINMCLHLTCTVMAIFAKFLAIKYNMKFFGDSVEKKGFCWTIKDLKINDDDHGY
ncbi:12813_t:CDS:1, partial [Dentiscutata heterogama]